MTKRILLVEDNLTDEKLTLRAFQNCGIVHDIVVVRDGAEALDYLFATGPYAGRDVADLPTLMLLDLQLPRIDGHEVLRRVRSDARTQLLPVVILTSSREDEDIGRGYALGANGYVRKPVDYAEFNSVARTLGLFWLAHNEPPPRRFSP